MEAIPKHPKRLKWLYLTLAALLTIIVSVNGPIARLAIKHFANQGLESAGLHGEFQLSGTIASGFNISNFSYSGDQAISQLDIGLLEVDYRLIREVLMQQKLRSLSLEQVTTVIDVAKIQKTQSPNKESTPIDLLQVRQTLNTVRQWIRPTEVHLGALDITLLNDGELLLQMLLGDMHYPADSDTITLNGYQLIRSAELMTPRQTSTITWLENAFEVTAIELLPKLGIDALQLSLSPEFSVRGALAISDATIDFSIDTGCELTLSQGLISSKDIIALLPSDIPINAQVDQLSLSLQNWKAPPADWELNASLALPEIYSQGYEIRSTQLDLRKQADTLHLEFNTQHMDALVRCFVDAEFKDMAKQAWWASFEVKLDTNLSRLRRLTNHYVPQHLELDTSKAMVQLHADAEVNELKLIGATTHASLSELMLMGNPLPLIELDASMNTEQQAKAKLTASLEDHPLLQLAATLDIPQMLYQASLTLDAQDRTWINTALQQFDVPVDITEALKLQWKGSGTATPQGPHRGDLTLEPMTLKTTQFELEPITIETALQYDWPQSIEVTKLSITEDSFHADFNAAWDGEIASLHSCLLSHGEEPLAAINAKIPLDLDKLSLDSYFLQDQEIDLHIKTQKLDIPRTLGWIPEIQDPTLAALKGSFYTELNIQGSLKQPELTGKVYLDDLVLSTSNFTSPIHLHLDLGTEQQKLFVQAQVIDQDKPRVDAQFHLPYKPYTWATADQPIMEMLAPEPLEGSLNIHSLPLQRIKELAPQIEDIEGALVAEAKLTGTIGEPTFTLDTNLSVPHIEIDNPNIDDVRKLELTCKVLSDRTLNAKITALVNGSPYKVTATSDFKDLKDPSFKVNATTDHALIFRDDKVSIRANANINVEGKLSDASISGKLELAESLFYQDIDILPIGVPSSAVSAVDLPPVTMPGLPLPIPEPFNTWKLDFVLGFADPLLIRGNIARGEVAGKVRATGTLERPKLDGTIATKDVLVKLPFSQLEIRKGNIVFDSKRLPLLPILDIQGVSTVNKYQTELFIYGSPLDPKITFTSQPPLPEADILTLIATGITPNDLKNNKEAATLRAIQLLLAKVKQNSEDSRSAKLLEILLSSVQNFEFNVNETDGFTGRKFSSAKINLNPKIFVTAQIDEEKNTRGLVVFVLKFR
ncbi:translocation/assembly module TamB domain-containing protein [Rubritalea marina]|uniref:translocation/assembly module TamB domain-containing protein n=1 Tax=Rubritalea marina TaxID=361055 RepID=UPI0003808A66|nr:translocation/assembly module TamB domain-containing protein [Rubritalea marina]